MTDDDLVKAREAERVMREYAARPGARRASRASCARAGPGW